MVLVRAPVLVAKWLIVGIAIVAWLVVVPVVDLVRSAFEATLRWIRH